MRTSRETLIEDLKKILPEGFEWDTEGLYRKVEEKYITPPFKASASKIYRDREKSLASLENFEVEVKIYKTPTGRTPKKNPLIIEITCN